MKDLLDRTKLHIKSILSTIASPFRPNLTSTMSAISEKSDLVSLRRKRPTLSRHVRYTREILKGENFEIGEYTYGIPNVFPIPGKKLKIGKFCSIASEVSIHLGGNHRIDRVTTYPFRAFVDDWPGAKYLDLEEVYGVSKGDVIIGNDVCIGYGATILSGVKIGDGAVVEARAVVGKDVEPYSIVAGNPARIIGKRCDEETISRLLEIKWWDWQIERIKRNLDVICGDNVSTISHLN